MYIFGPKSKIHFVIGHPPTCTPSVVYMSAQVFRDPKSSNIIQISRFVQFLLTFDSFQASPWGVGVGGWGWDSVRVFGVVPYACAHMHTHARMYVHVHTCINMIISCKWLLPCNGFPQGIPIMTSSLMCVCACVCMHVHTCMGTPPNTMTESYPILPSTITPRGNPRNQLKFDNTSSNQDISIPFEDLKSVKNVPHIGGCRVWWVGGWFGGLMSGVRSKH